jgi:hypothetical protein
VTENEVTENEVTENEVTENEVTENERKLIVVKQCEAEYSTFQFGHFIRKTRLSTTHLDRTGEIILVNI